jgi:hypothetical protein
MPYYKKQQQKGEVFTVAKKAMSGKSIALKNAENPKGEWFNLAQNVQPYMKSYNVGDKVEVSFKDIDGVQVVSFIKKADDSSTSKTASKVSKVVESNKSTFKPYSKTPEEQQLIVKQSVLASSARIVAALVATGEIKSHEVLALTEEVFNSSLALVNGSTVAKTDKEIEEAVEDEAEEIAEEIEGTETLEEITEEESL